MRSVTLNTLIAAVALVACIMPAHAEYAGNVEVRRVRLDGTTAWVGVGPQAAGTCSNWGEHLKFDHTTAAGKNFLSTILTAKAMGGRIDVWYTLSSAPDTDQSNGCGSAATSVLSGVAIR